MKRFFKHARMSPLLCGAFFAFAMLFCAVDASAQFRASEHEVYSIDLKTALVAKSFKPHSDAMNALSQQAQVYRQSYAAQQGTDNEALHMLRINYFTGVANEIDKGGNVMDALMKTFDSTLLPEARNYGVVTGASLQLIYNEAVALVTI